MAGSNDFWKLQYNLPEETRNHVKRFIGTHYIFEGNGGLTTMTASEIKEQEKAVSSANRKTGEASLDPNFKSVQISGKYRASVIAKLLGIEKEVFIKLNPYFDKIISSGKAYNLTLPIEKVTAFEANKNEILSQSVEAMLNS